MHKIKLGTSDVEVSRLCYGCMSIGGNWESSPLQEDVHRAACTTLDAAVEAGISFFDHADIYCRTKSEEAFGRWLADRPDLRDQIVIQSKCGIRFGDDPPGTPFRFDFSYEHITRSVENILRRLRIDCLDVLLLHRPDPLVEPQEVARAFDDLECFGKVRQFGVSNHSAAQIDLLRRYVLQPLLANQVEISLLHAEMIDAGTDWNIGGLSGQVCGDGTLEYCRRHDITLQAWSPLARGLLGDAEPKADDPRAGRIAELKPMLADLAAKKGVSPGAVALAWLLRHPAGIVPIIGTTRPEKIRDACQADTLELTREEWNSLYIAARGRRLP
jgi:predicted oxidoreductase